MPPSNAGISQGLSTGLNVMSGITSGVTNYIMQEKANQQNIEFWEMQNAYDHPKAQMERLQAAGLNPHLVYGGSPGQVAGQAAPAPNIQPSKHKQNPIDTMQFFAAEKQMAETDNIRKQTELTASQIVGQDRRNILLGYDADLKSIGLDLEHMTFDSKKDYSISRARNEGINTNIKTTESDRAKQALKYETSNRRIKEMEEKNFKLGITSKSSTMVQIAGAMYREQTPPPHTAAGFKKFYKNQFARIGGNLLNKINSNFYDQ